MLYHIPVLYVLSTNSLLYDHLLDGGLQLEGPLLGQFGGRQQQFLQHAKGAVMVGRVRGGQLQRGPPCLQLTPLLQHRYRLTNWFLKER